MSSPGESVPGAASPIAIPPVPANCLAIVRPHLPEPVLTAAAARRLESLYRLLPDGCLSALELRLGDHDPRVDLAVRLLEPEHARELARRCRAPHLCRMLTRWAEGGLRPFPIPSLWLEFDLDQDRELAELPLPCLCVELKGPIDDSWLADDLVPSMQGRPLSAAQRDVLGRCRRLLPSGARLLYLASMLPRPADTLRAEAVGLDVDQATHYLEQIGSAASAARVRELAPLFRPVERLHLSFDIGAEIGPRVGIECGWRRQPRHEPRWRQTLVELAGRRLCSTAKLEAVLAWPGWDSRWTTPAVWPASGGAGGACMRCLSHLKVVFSPDRDPEAKAYLLFGYFSARQGDR